jgi:hypothetical protein
MLQLLNRILTLNLICTTLVFFVAAKIYVLPRLSRVEPKHILVPVLLLHSMRHLGLMFLTPGAVYPGMPPQFAYPAAMGDFATAVLAFVAIPFVLSDFAATKPLLWVFNLFGSIDLITAISLATIYDAPVYMGPSYWIPAFWVPALLVTHYLVFVMLTRSPKRNI